MILKIIFTDDDIQRFFEANGFQVEERDFGQWTRVTHGADEFLHAPHPAVVINGRHVKARQLFDRIAEKRLRKYLAPVNLESRRMIEMEFKTLTKSI